MKCLHTHHFDFMFGRTSPRVASSLRLFGRTDFDHAPMLASPGCFLPEFFRSFACTRLETWYTSAEGRANPATIARAPSHILSRREGPHDDTHPTQSRL